MTAQITREAALRLGLAAAELGGISVAAFAQAVGERLGLPLTETRLSSITVTDLREILAGDHAEEDCKVGVDPDTLKQVARLLWGEDLVHSELPPLDAHARGDLPGSIQVACASNHGEVLDGHFGSCERFLIYQLTPEASPRLVAIRPTLEADHAEDRNAARAALVAGLRCGVCAVDRRSGGSQGGAGERASVKVPRAESAHTVIARLQASLKHPPPWLAKVMGVPAPSLQMCG